MGHEDIGYSYVVIRRGSRPTAGNTKVGRVGDVGKWATDKEALSRVPVKELMLHVERDGSDAEHSNTAITSTSIGSSETDGEANAPAELEEALRMEAFGWPRIVFSPLKRSGHVILDSCTAEGESFMET
jgi:ribosomal protein RSM22 (predicted rRNA methylase)